jgi:hypothetical protein
MDDSVKRENDVREIIIISLALATSVCHQFSANDTSHVRQIDVFPGVKMPENQTN